MFKKYLLDHNLNFDLYMPTNQKEVDQVIQHIKQNNEEKNA
jgi:hypothetical protein